MSSELTDQLVEFALDRPLAHRVLFAHRHVNRAGVLIPSAPFHEEMAEDWASDHPFILDMLFRGAAKSTTAEEAAILGALYSEFKYCLVCSYSQPKAVERLAAIRHEFHTNEMIQALYGEAAELEIDTATEIVTRSGIKFDTLGRGQSLRGKKHFDSRPDLVIIDDIEDRIDIASPEARKKTWDWLTRDLLPAMDPEGRVRMTATPLHPESVPMRLKRDPGVLVREVPIMYRAMEEDVAAGRAAELGEWVAAWPDRFPIEACLKLEASYRSRGEVENFKQEYMVQAEAPELKPFKREMMILSPQVRTWQAVYAMTDPARSVKGTAATTGRAVWSWISGRLVVWDAWGKRILPDEIVRSMFDGHAEHSTTWEGVEEDGLNEWLLQPLRQEQVKRGQTLPLKAVRAPKGKLDFIRGLQPFFMGREVSFAKPLPDLEAQLLGFPSGDIDVPNALAYALKLRPGAPLYDEFGPRHISEGLRGASGRPVYLCLSAASGLLTGVCCQAFDGYIRVLADFVREGDPGGVLADAVSELQLAVGGPVQLIGAPRHWDRYNNVGLVQAAKRIPKEIRPGADPDRGRALIRQRLQRERQGTPLVLVSTSARWTLNGFAGGFARALSGAGVLSDKPEAGVYATLFEGLEAFASMLEAGSPDESDDAKNYSVTRDGRRYVSTLGNRGR